MKNMNLPNKLTLLRVCMIPLFMIFALIENTPCQLIAVLVFLAASLTDYLDGYIARKCNLVTDFGKFMDPIADKMLTHTAFIMLCAMGRLNVVACIIFVAREFVVSGLRLCAVEQGHVIAAGMSGKIKTVLQMILVLWLTVMLPVPFIGGLLTLAAAALTLYSMVEYVWQNRAVLGGAK